MFNLVFVVPREALDCAPSLFLMPTPLVASAKRLARTILALLEVASEMDLRNKMVPGGSVCRTVICTPPLGPNDSPSVCIADFFTVRVFVAVMAGALVRRMTLPVA